MPGGGGGGSCPSLREDGEWLSPRVANAAGLLRRPCEGRQAWLGHSGMSTLDISTPPHPPCWPTCNTTKNIPKPRKSSSRLFDVGAFPFLHEAGRNWGLLLISKRKRFVVFQCGRQMGCRGGGFGGGGNTAHPERAIGNQAPPSLPEVPANSTTSGAAPSLHGGACHRGGRRAVTTPRAGQSMSCGDTKSSCGGTCRRGRSRSAHAPFVSANAKGEANTTKQDVGATPGGIGESAADMEERGGSEAGGAARTVGEAGNQKEEEGSVRMGGNDSIGEGLASQPCH